MSSSNSDCSSPPPSKRVRLSSYDTTRDIFLNQLGSSVHSSHINCASSSIGKSQTLLTNSAILPKSSITIPNPNKVSTLLNSSNSKKLIGVDSNVKRVLIQFRTRSGMKTGPPIDIPIGCDPNKLNILINSVLGNNKDYSEIYSFYYISNPDEINKEKENKDKLYINSEILTSIRKFISNEYIKSNGSIKISTENIINIVYEAQAIFKVQPITRCSAEISGHSDAILKVAFKPDCKQIASCSGDTTVRLWNVYTQSPIKILRGHKTWVLDILYSPDGEKLLSGDKDGVIVIWSNLNNLLSFKDDKTNNDNRIIKQAHSSYITSLAWEPYHLTKDGTCNKFATSSKDKTIKIWNSNNMRLIYSLSGHTNSVTCIKWSGSDNGYIYSSSKDTTIRLWDPNKGICLKIFKKHSHWVNFIALSTEYALLTGPYDNNGNKPDNISDCIKESLNKYNTAKNSRGEIMVSCSDDFTLYLWNPLESIQPVARMTGHQQLVNHVLFSPDSRYIASASFDKSIRIWDSLTGKLIVRLLGHVQSVYKISWSADSRMLASASKDSTVKLWNLKNKKLIIDLPGNSDEVYDVNWAYNGRCLVSGGKDTILRIWQP